MVDEIYDRTYQAGRAEFNAGLDRGFARIGNALAKSLKVLHRIEWSAPWNSNSKNTQCG